MVWKAGGVDEEAAEDDPNVKEGAEFPVLDKAKGLAGSGVDGAPKANSEPEDEVPDWPPKAKLVEDDVVVAVPDDCTANEKVEGDEIPLAPNGNAGNDDVDVTADEDPKVNVGIFVVDVAADDDPNVKAGGEDDSANESGSSAIGSAAIISASASLSAPGPSVAITVPFSPSDRSSIAVAASTDTPVGAAAAASNVFPANGAPATGDADDAGTAGEAAVNDDEVAEITFPSLAVFALPFTTEKGFAFDELGCGPVGKNCPGDEIPDCPPNEKLTEDDVAAVPDD